MRDSSSKLDIQTFLRKHSESFILKWQSGVEEIIKNDQNHNYPDLSQQDYLNLFENYINDINQDDFTQSSQFLIKLIQEKTQKGLSLSTVELINASFMTTARELFRSYYPDDYERRTEYLEKLSQLILNNEISLARHYEDHLLKLNHKLEKIACTSRKNYKILGNFMNIATHQLQTPLWSIIGFVSNLQRKYYETIDEKGRHYLNRITANVSTMHQLIEDVAKMLLIDEQNMIKKEIYLFDVISHALRQVRDELDENFICEVLDDLNVKILGDPAQLRHMFYQIFKNSCQYTQHEVSGNCKAWSKRLDNQYIIFIEDSGIGIENQYRELVFEPMERLNEKEVPGSGMGLTFARRIAEAHNGFIEIINPLQSTGICVKLTFEENIIFKVRQELDTEDGHEDKTAGSHSAG